MNEYEPKPISPFASLAILGALTAAGLVIGLIVAIGIWVGMTGQSPVNLEKDILNPQFTNAARWMQMVSVFFMFFVPALATARIINPRPFTYLGYNEGFNWKQLLLVFAIIMICLPLVGALGELNQAIPISKTWETYFKKLEANYEAQVQALATMRSPGEFIFSLFIIALLPAVFEETLFRGGLQQILTAWFKHPMAAIIVTSIIFSAVHFSYYGFIPRFALGMVLGLIFYYSKSIWLNMAAHFINNAFAISYMYYFTMHNKPVKEALDDSAPIWMGLPALIAVVLLLRLFQKISLKRNIHKIPPMDGPSFESTLA